MAHYVLTLGCPDRTGIVARISTFLSEAGGSITEAGYHLDPDSNWFFTRQVVQADTLPFGLEELRERFAAIAAEFDAPNSWRVSDTGRPPRVVILVSKEGHCLYDLLGRHAGGELDMDVRAVIGNHTDLEKITRAHDIPFHHVPFAPGAQGKRAAFDQVRTLVDGEQPDAVVLARFMQIVPPDLCEAWAGRMLNIHHSFLPSFIGAKPYHQAHTRGVKLVGATCHYVTENLDAGPIVEQDVIRVDHSDTVADMVRKGRDIEKVVLARGLRAHLESRVLVYGNRTVVFHRSRAHPTRPGHGESLVTTIYPTIAEAIEHSPKTAKAPLAWNPTDHVLSRLAFGPTPAARAEIAKNGIPSWLNAQVAAGHSYAGYGGDPLVAAQATRLGLSPADSFTLLKLGGNKYGWDVMTQLTQTTLGLQVWSKAQLYEVLVDFFANHLNVVCPRADLWVTRHTFDRDVIRKHALGSFTDMLLASARNPAMLLYLDLATSTKTAVNENYARELLELHTVGLVFSEADVKNVAKLLTGRTVSERTYDYTYNPANHGTGAVRVLDFRHANDSAADGEAGGDALLRYLARHPSTAKRLARKLCTRLVSDRPSMDLVAAVAKAYLDADTQILPMLDTILRSSEFWAARGQKVRRPAENVIATLRILEVRPASLTAALKYLQTMTQQVGNQPLAWGPPNGYPDVAAAWRSASSLLMLWLHHLGLAADSWTNAFAKSNKTTLYGGMPANSGDAIARLGVRLTGAPLPVAHAQALQTFLAESATTPMAKSTLHVLLPALIALILDGPSHALR